MRGAPGGFPATYQDLPTSLLIAAYAAGPGRLRQALGGLDLAALRARPRAGKWSILETAMHVTDSEFVGAGRIRLALAQPGTAFYAYDQEAWVRTLRHQEADAAALENALLLLEALRACTLPLFARATDEEWRRTAVHAEYGPITLRHLLELYADHVERHLEQILECRRLLGIPHVMPAILALRLY